MVEVDVVNSSDNVLFAFHNGKEFDIRTLPSSEIEKLEYINIEGGLSGRGVERIEDILLKLKGDYLINIDRGWDYLPEIFDLVTKLKMENQVIIKAGPEEKVLNFLKNSKKKLMFMPIVRDEKSLDLFLKENINVVAVEVLFDKENHELNSQVFKKKLKEKGILLWINAIKLDNSDEFNFAAGHSDDRGLENSGKDWQWIIDNGANIIQTDWVYFLNKYRNKILEK